MIEYPLRPKLAMPVPLKAPEMESFRVGAEMLVLELVTGVALGIARSDVPLVFFRRMGMTAV